MFATIPTTTETLTLDDLIRRLAGHSAVDGIVVMGSASDETLNPASDYDLYVVLSSMPEPLFMLLTSVERRLTEIYFTTAEAVDRILALVEPTVASRCVFRSQFFVPGATHDHYQNRRSARRAHPYRRSGDRA
jgi:hypothetical protein